MQEKRGWGPREAMECGCSHHEHVMCACIEFGGSKGQKVKEPMEGREGGEG